MTQLVECIPNFSEGRRMDVVQGIAEAIASAGAQVLNVNLDADHHRSVVTFIGSPDTVVEGMLRGAAVALREIDIRAHTGVHPRIGAVDVVPFVPLRNISLEACVALAHTFGARAAQSFSVPVYYYESAARQADRVNLAHVRQGGFESLRDGIGHDPRWHPDEGPSLVGTGGGMIVGARGPLIAFNVYLSTRDVSIAREIALAIRESGGGLRAVKALGLLVDGRAQVSMNLTDFRVNGLFEVMTRLHELAASYGVQVTESELIGLTPRAALADYAFKSLRLPQGARAQILEDRIGEITNDYSECIFE
ncbi:MAG: glutamate formimidoyltransferase [Pleurocapsa minor GSE-CHR-MK-17-07R]|jgi:glutamate formiminotransferase|nr:glutamate formimidoyltransferase [Pleurocapsa minor GSE-CHR-MK 17-07R]